MTENPVSAPADWLQKFRESEQKLLTVRMIADAIPPTRGAAKSSPTTVVRWITTGCTTRSGMQKGDGTRAFLKAIRVGSRWMVNPADLVAFFEELAK